MKDPNKMTTEELIEMADEIKKGMGTMLLEDYRKLKHAIAPSPLVRKF